MRAFAGVLALLVAASAAAASVPAPVPAQLAAPAKAAAAPSSAASPATTAAPAGATTAASPPTPSAPAAAPPPAGKPAPAAAATPSPTGAPAAPAAPPAAPAAPSVEYTLSLSHEEWRVRVTLHPGELQAGHLVALLVDVGRHKDGEPGSTETIPYENGKLGLTVSGPGSRLRYLVRPLGDAGIYGAHWTPGAKGLWTLSIAPLVQGEAGPAVSFQVGVGVPMPASAQGHAVQTSRVVVAAGRSIEEQTALSVKAVMAELGQRWLKLVDPAPGEESADAKAEMVAIAALSRGLVGRVPKAWAKESGDYDTQAEQLAAALDKAAALKDRKAQIAALAPLEQASCLRCHVKFRDSVVADVSSWPEVKK